MRMLNTVAGHKILENYITTEAGTALCNRVAGSQIPGTQSRYTVHLDQFSLPVILRGSQCADSQWS
jgi:hypothetical protein